MALAFAASTATCTVANAKDFFCPGEFFFGVNYWGSQAGVRMWRAENWSEREIEKDIAALAASGVEVMRVFPTWSEFQPVETAPLISELKTAIKELETPQPEIINAYAKFAGDNSAMERAAKAREKAGALRALLEEID